MASGNPVIAPAIRNVVAHEANRLAGLNDVEDPMALMDSALPADTSLDVQDFIEAPLFPQIMELSTQDSLLLSEMPGIQ